MNKAHSFAVSGRLTRYPGTAGWLYVSLSKRHSEPLSKRKSVKRPAWNHVYVDAKIGKTTWRTTLWPKQKDGVYLLLVKADVRKKEGIVEGSDIRVTLRPV